MKPLLWKLVIPLTVISFIIITKWWYVVPVDAPDTMMSGFPLPYVCDGWHTSMSLQIFVLELLIDLGVYFLFWCVAVICIHRFVMQINVHRLVTILLTTIAGLFVCGFIFVVSFPDNLFYLKRDFEMDVLTTGTKFIWEGSHRPENFDFDTYKGQKGKR